MDKPTRSAIERATQQARKLLDDDFSLQLEGTFDVLRIGVIASKGGDHLAAREHFQRGKIVSAIEHKRVAGTSAAEAIRDYVRDAAFTTLNRFVALKMLEARQLVQECITKGEQSAGYREFCGMAPGLALLPDARGYRLYIESLFDEFSTEIKVLFDRRDAASILWPKRQTFEALLTILNAPDLVGVWGDDETIGWVYQYFNSGEERKDMREESSAPRNSRELAVRNQFFTPRYIVRFLTDNTLGRLWLEMYGDKTQLIGLCGYLVRSVEERIQARARKDPRDLRVLDPACGSGHFLLYCFDLLLEIYEEAWAAQGTSPKSESTGHSLRDDYPSLADLRRAAPRLIVENNLHGVDIDPRCAQIAALALWLRAQRAWNDAAISAADRPHIQRTRVVVAEPMPGDTGLVDEFALRLDPPLLRDLFKKMVGETRLAGELGTLLRLEDGIAGELHRARQQFVQQRQTSRFLPGMEPLTKQGSLDLSGIADDHFFHEAEARIVQALRAFAESTIGSASVRRRLFAGDAAQGISLIELVRTKFDVVLMNPPYGKGTEPAKGALAGSYPNHWLDVYLAFIARMSELAPEGYVGALVSRTWMFLSKFEKARRGFTNNRQISCLVDLGSGVLDGATVETSAVVISPRGGVETFLFGRISEIEDKAQGLRDAVDAYRRGDLVPEFRLCNSQEFSLTPGGALIFQTPDPANKLKQVSQTRPFTARPGIQTSDDFRFTRAAWEIGVGDYGRHGWATAIFGSQESRFFTNHPLCLKWFCDGREVAAYIEKTQGSASRGMRNAESYFHAGLCYQYTGKQFRVHLLPKEAVISVAGQGLYPENQSDTFALLALLNSDAVTRRLKEINPGRFFQASYVNALSLIAEKWNENHSNLDRLGRELTELQASLSVRDETSFLFELNSLNSAPSVTARQWASQLLLIFEKASELETYACDILGYAHRSLQPSDIDVPELEREASFRLSSLAVGIAFGRWPFLGGAKAAESHLPTLFDARPAFRTSPDAIAIRPDDPGHADDLVSAAWKYLTDLPTDVGTELSSLLWDGVASEQEFRSWIRTRYFECHLSQYTAGRRKAPVYWQLGTPSASYTIWLYFPALTKDTLYKVYNDYVVPKVEHEQRKLQSLRDEFGPRPSAINRKALTTQEEYVDELREFLDEVKRVAPLWTPTTDDGVVLIMAPLWRLAVAHKPWQKELKSKWDDLRAGKYDWAHIAMHLWPERVIPKCATDRSFAIAHGLEAVFWSQGEDGKWKPRAVPKRSIDALVSERTSAAVKSALKELTEVSGSNGSKTNDRRASS